MGEPLLNKYFKMIDSEQVCKGKVKSTEIKRMKETLKLLIKAIIKLMYLLYNGKSATYLLKQAKSSENNLKRVKFNI
jgi:hypothetical protein